MSHESLTKQEHKIKELFNELGKRFKKSNFATLLVDHPTPGAYAVNKLVHAFYSLDDNPLQIIHLKGYPDEDLSEKVVVLGNLISSTAVSGLGSELNSGVSMDEVLNKIDKYASKVFYNMKENDPILYDVSILEHKVKDNFALDKPRSRLRLVE